MSSRGGFQQTLALLTIISEQVMRASKYLGLDPDFLPIAASVPSLKIYPSPPCERNQKLCSRRSSRLRDENGGGRDLLFNRHHYCDSRLPHGSLWLSLLSHWKDTNNDSKSSFATSRHQANRKPGNPVKALPSL